MPVDRDSALEERDYAAHLLVIVQQELAEIETSDPTSVTAVVLHALSELFEDAAHGYVTLAGLPVAPRQGLEDERLITPPQTALVGLDDRKNSSDRHSTAATYA